MSVYPQYTVANAAGAVNLNDHVAYWCDLEGVDLGEKQTTWQEEVTYAGGPNAQTHVLRGGLVVCTFPMWTQGATATLLKAARDALWTVIDACAPGGASTLVAKMDATLTETYTLGYCTRPSSIPRGASYQFGFLSEFVLILTRQP